MIQWEVCKFGDLDVETLYQILRLRNEVFIVEQHCPYQDLDNSDQQAIHVIGFAPEGLAAYTRLFAPGIKYDAASIGRVVTATFARGSGVGRQLMERSLAEVERFWGDVPVQISAQLYLQKFYESLGFATISETYLEDDIPHIAMIKSKA